MKNFTDTEKRAMFKALASKSYYNVGIDFGLDKHLDSRLRIINAVSAVYREVLNDPNRFAVPQETIELVQHGLEGRKGKGVEGAVDDKTLEELDLGKLVLGARTKAWVLLNRKLDYLMRNKKAFRNESIQKLAWVSGLSFDKAQIQQGNATEHIAVLAKVKDGITVQEAMQALLKNREAKGGLEEEEE